MFTGIVTDIATVRSLDKANGTGLALAVPFATSGIDVGASICCAGVCLTVVEKGPRWLRFDASEETLKRTTIDGWKQGTPVNIERALKASDALGGHIVMGHIDAIAEVLDIVPMEGGEKFTFSLPKSIAHLVAEKGCIAIDGVSLTVNGVAAESFDLVIIPHTKQATTFKSLKKSDKVNLEADIFARYSARLNEVRDQDYAKTR